MVMPGKNQPAPREHIVFDLDIESVVFHDVLHLNRQRVCDALHGELSRLLSENEVSSLTFAAESGEIDVLHGLTLNISINMPAEVVGQRLARAIFNALREAKDVHPR